MLVVGLGGGGTGRRGLEGTLVDAVADMVERQHPHPPGTVLVCIATKEGSIVHDERELSGKLL